MFMLPEGTLISAFIGGAISKVINDGVDYSKPKIKRVVNDKNNRNYSTKIYRVIEKSLNIVTDKKFKDTDKLYDAIEKIFIEFQNHGDTLESVKCGLSVLGADVSDQRCENFLEIFYEGIRMDDDLYKTVMMDLEQRGIKISQEEFRKLNEKNDKNHMELVEKLDDIKENLNEISLINEKSVDTKDLKFQNNKKQDYIKNWNSRLFLHLDNNERPITLADAFIMPDFEMYKKNNRIGFTDDDSLENIINKFVKYDRTSTMLITGVPGIGKSTITSWIANKYIDDDKFVILRFRDWGYEELKEGILNSVCVTLKCKKKDLESKVLILEGYDEMKTLNIREYLLKAFFIDIKDLKNLKCIITSRPSYISSMDFQNGINILPFNSEQVGTFYFKIKNKKINHKRIDWDNLEILGIPVILYMAIMSNINIERSFTKPELYSRIFAIRGGIFDRFYDGETEYGTGGQILRKPKNIKKYLMFLQDTAFKMFEKNDLQLKKEECRVPELECEKKKISVLEFPIKHLFENTEDNIEFIHKSIYEFFVSEYIFGSIYKVMNDSDDKFACCIGECLEGEVLSEEIIEFIEYRVYNSKEMINQFERFAHIFEKMMNDGMTYYVKRRLKKVINRETIVFTNMLHILHLWEFESLHMNPDLVRYYLQDKEIMYDLSNLSLMRANLKGINLVRQNLQMTNLRKTDLRGADLREADLRGANLCGADLRRADLRSTMLEGSIWYESDIRKALSQLKTANFTYLMIREDNGVKMVQRSELSPDENNL